MHGNHGKKRQTWLAGEAWKPSSVFSNNAPWQITEMRTEKHGDRQGAKLRGVGERRARGIAKI
ncbi:hypothetical protein [Paraburkholderia bannensis]|uniref:hypothetical protein n=1 Tax=Paraburkholderia bannensis TaxID=765414 RepID=UPI002AC3280B|nr:hypothetical protein [Paraburkholderia bannensis]